MAIEIRNTADLGRIIRYHRERAGLGRVGLSELSGVGPTVIYELERGKKTVQMNIVTRLLSTLNLRLLVDGPLVDEYRIHEQG